MAAINDKFIFDFLNDPNYKVDASGIILTCVNKQGHTTNQWREKILINKSGYKSINYKRKRLQVHRIIYAFVYGSLDSNLVINHIDGNPSNNNSSNLEQVTIQENNIHMYRVLKHPGVKGNTKLNQTDADEIRRLVAEENRRACDLAKAYDVSKGTISYILNNKTWLEK